MMKFPLLVLLLFAFNASSVVGQKLIVQSPNQKIKASVFCRQSADVGEWYIQASYNNEKITEAIPRIDV